jgi:PAS domain S-box-containing protein
MSQTTDDNGQAQANSPEPAAVKPGLQAPARMWRHWWRAQTPAKQDRVATFGPLVAVVLFLTAIVLSIGYLRLEEADREQETITRDVEYAQQRLRLHLLERREQLLRLARAVSEEQLQGQRFEDQAKALIDIAPDLETIALLGVDHTIHTSYTAQTAPISRVRYQGEQMGGGDAADAFQTLSTLKESVYTRPMRDHQDIGNANAQMPMGSATLMLLVPVMREGQLRGSVMAEFSIDGLLRYGVPGEVLTKYAVALVDGSGEILAGSMPRVQRLLARWLPWAAQQFEYEVAVSPIGSSLMFKARAWRTSSSVIGTTIFWLVAALSALTLWMLMGNWRHTRKRLETQHALMAETNFRRAMENSMLTGMRALDMQGRITYVNPAFCQMTGWSESELVGRTPPFPYWPRNDQAMLAARLEDELKGRSNPGGFEVRVQRKNDTIFAARMYVSPLIAPSGLQTGWMTSMTDITEPKRIREELGAAHERFTTVLESLDAAVSVASLGGKELLFANKQYRNWFNAQALGHYEMVMQAQLGVLNSMDSAANRSDFANAQHDDGSDDGSDNGTDDIDDMAGLPVDTLLDAQAADAQVFIEGLGKWLEVRSRYITWVDGRLAQIVIATDITARHEAQAQAAIQMERAQTASRLITMGEMASSVAHELNQPLAAISNYCSGMISRINNKGIAEEDLLTALDKTAKQAQRAGQIIARIRSFVKRSEPNRTPSDALLIVQNATELADIELRRHQVRLTPYLAERMPALMVDPILIEQVLINLIKNAAESIQQANRPVGQRSIELRVRPRVIEGKDTLEFSVRDNGAGVPAEMLERIYDAFYSTKSEGMGIGLKLCRSIVESHQGRLSVENLYNGELVCGCVFCFWLPVHPAGPVIAGNTRSSNSGDQH